MRSLPQSYFRVTFVSRSRQVLPPATRPRAHGARAVNWRSKRCIRSRSPAIHRSRPWIYFCTISKAMRQGQGIRAPFGFRRGQPVGRHRPAHRPMHGKLEARAVGQGRSGDPAHGDLRTGFLPRYPVAASVWMRRSRSANASAAPIRPRLSTECWIRSPSPAAPNPTDARSWKNAINPK